MKRLLLGILIILGLTLASPLAVFAGGSSDVLIIAVPGVQAPSIINGSVMVVTFNHALMPLPAGTQNDFTFTDNGSPRTFSMAILAPDNVTLSLIINGSAVGTQEVIFLSYNGTSIESQMSQMLANFSGLPVLDTYSLLPQTSNVIIVNPGGNTSSTLTDVFFTSVMDTSIIAILAMLLFIICFWQKKMWLFVVDGTIWWGMAILNFETCIMYSNGWVLAWVYLMLGLACITATLWLHEKRDAPMESPQDQGYHEMKERIKERQAKRNAY